MVRYTRHPLYNYVPRMDPYRVLRIIFILTCFFCISVHFLFSKLFNCNNSPVPEVTRLYPNMPLTINLRSYPVCHPDEFYLKTLILQYHRRYPNKDKQTCFLIDSLDGGSWWSYVTHEFAEILTDLKRLSIQSNITYQSFPNATNFNYKTNLTKYFLNACDMDETLPKEHQRPIVILLWDVNRLLWYQMRQQWNSLLEKTRTRLLVFIDDLHFTTPEVFSSRQFLFQSVASEILSTYPYLFHNYYTNISPKKITWLPHAASTLPSPVINQTAKNTLLVSGANMFDWYPCRARAFLVCNTRKDLASCLRHPGYGETMRNSSSYYYGERYFSYMRNYVFGLATCQSVHYAIAKLFELPANGVALVTTNDLVPILESLHLYRDEHFLTVDCSSLGNLKNEITRLQHISKENIFQIRKKSQEIVYARHLTKHRAELLHVRLLSHALIASSKSDEEIMQWEHWGRNCY